MGLWSHRKPFGLEELDRYTEPLCRGLAFFEKPDLKWRALREDCVQFAVMSACDAWHKNSGFHRRTPKTGKTPEQGDVKNISKVKVDRVDRLRVAEAIERFSGARFLVPNKRDDFVNDRFVKNTARSLQEESEVLFKLDVWRKLHPPLRSLPRRGESQSDDRRNPTRQLWDFGPMREPKSLTPARPRETSTIRPWSNSARSFQHVMSSSISYE